MESAVVSRALEPGRPARRRGLHRDAVDELGRRIVSGQIPIGDTLPNEADLGDEMGISRTVVREAVKVLAAKGLVETRPRMGTRVQPRSRWDLVDHDVLDWIVASSPPLAFYRDVFEVRSIIEPRAAQLAAERRTPTEAERIDQLLRSMEASVDDREAYIVADLRFHAAVIAAAHNELLSRLGGTLSVALRAGRAVTTRIADGPSSSIALHTEVACAIRGSDPAAAHRAMEALIRYATRDMEVVLAGADDGSGRRR
jgi:GntR family transcriptional regulator, galactonate operon transcriptional repressor